MKRLLLVNGTTFPGIKLPGSYAVSVANFLKSHLQRNLSFSLFFLVSFFTAANAQPVSDVQKLTDYRKVIEERSAKIVNTLSITDSVKYTKLVQEIADQYAGLNAIHEDCKSVMVKIKAENITDNEKEEAIKNEEKIKIEKLKQLHEQFLGQLKEDLSEDQLEKVKDGMTYNVLNVTYTAYKNMILTLTASQKDTIYNWLKEAREKAMDEGSSEDKHKMFGKYKGRINNYLSSQGYDMKAEEKAWQQRLKEKQ